MVNKICKVKIRISGDKKLRKRPASNKAKYIPKRSKLIKELIA